MSDLPSADFDAPTLADEWLLWDYLDTYLNANGAMPEVAGRDAKGTLFLAWLDEEGGDCVGLRVVRLVQNDGGTSSALTEVEAPAQGCVSGLSYPVVLFEPRPIPPVEGGE